jgi:predicted RNA-binding Zn-ribbon protein involved in translation (DUF1610 family)
MNRFLLLLATAALAALMSAGCQTQGARSALAGKVDHAPKAIPVLKQEALVHECPKCGMDYDQAGRCTMCDVELVRTAVAYKCPTDGKPVERSGPCPRCAASVVVEKTAIADAGGAAH